jgi:hypothetical protein
MKINLKTNKGTYHNFITIMIFVRYFVKTGAIIDLNEMRSIGIIAIKLFFLTCDTQSK